MVFYKALKWSLAAEMAAKMIQPLVFLILTAMLAPSDFGIMAAATMVVSFSQVFWDAGLGKALIQSHDNRQTAANVVFWINLILGILIAGALYFSATPIAALLFQDPRVAQALKVMTILVILGSLGSVQTALLQKDFAFRRLFWLRLSSTLAPGLASIPLAINGFGYWALVTGAIIGQFVQVVLLWQSSSFRPQLSFDIKVAKSLAGFGAWVGITAFVAWLYTWADTFIVGAFLGAHDLGLYRTGNLIASMILGSLFAPVLPVLYSRLVQHQCDINLLRSDYTLAFSLFALMGASTGIALWFSGPIFEDFLFGSEWVGIGLVIGMLGLAQGAAWSVGANGEFYRALGKPHYETLIGTIGLLLYLPVYWWSVGYGLTYFLAARIACTGLGIATQVLFAKATLGAPNMKDLIRTLQRFRLRWLSRS